MTETTLRPRSADLRRVIPGDDGERADTLRVELKWFPGANGGYWNAEARPQWGTATHGVRHSYEAAQDLGRAMLDAMEAALAAWREFKRAEARYLEVAASTVEPEHTTIASGADEPTF